MIEHRLYNGKYGKHIINKTQDTIETLVRYVCNLENTNKYKIIIGNDIVVDTIEKEFPLEDHTIIQLGLQKYKISDLSKRIRHRLYFIKDDFSVISVMSEILEDIKEFIKTSKADDFEIIIGIDSKNIETYKKYLDDKLKELNLENNIIYYYEGVEFDKENNS